MGLKYTEEAFEDARKSQGIELIAPLDELKLKPWYAPGYFYLGELYVKAGQKEKALENLRKAEDMFQEMGMDYRLAETSKVLAEL